MALRIGVIVGEPSGDRLGAQLAKALKSQDPSIEIEGVIGPEMIQEGCVQLCSMDILGVMGFIDPIKSLPSILKMRKWILRYFLEDPPDVFIGIDAPDFNLGVEKILREAGIPTVHFVSPSVWAWRGWRIKKIKKAVDLMLTLFPFEEQFYQKHDVPVFYTGHPTADLIPLDYDKQQAKKELMYDVDDIVVAVLPGSRNSELKHMVNVYLNTIKICSAANPNLKFVIPLVQPAYKEYIEFHKNKIDPTLQIKYVLGNSFAVMRAADFALVTSGTATLELMLHHVPMLVAFKTNRIQYEIAKHMVYVKYISLPNLLSNDSIVPEYIQHAANPKDLSRALLELIDSSELQNKQRAKFIELHKVLQQGAAIKAASAIRDLLYMV